jgi:hypothetical protein
MSNTNKYINKTFNDIKNIFLGKKCKLLTSENEFNILKETNNLNSNTKFLFNPKCCNIEKIMRIHCFVKQPRSDICKECQNKLSKLKSDNNCNIIEYDSYKYFTSLLNNFDIVKTKEGCRFDLAIKDKNINEDKYLQIQLKSTVKKSNDKSYSFSLNNNTYQNGIICLICSNDNKIWILDGAINKNNKKISIGNNSTKYSKYEVNKDNINNSLLKFYNDKEKFSKEICLTPINIYQQREQKYMKLREDKMKYLQITYPEIEGQCYDLIINGYKVQDKVIGKRSDRKNSYIISLYRNNGRTNCKRNYRCYNKGDNDFYWFWYDDSSLFYVVKEEDLIKLKCVQEDNDLDNKRIQLTFSYNDSPVKTLLDKNVYDYNDPELESKLNKLFLN